MQIFASLQLEAVANLKSICAILQNGCHKLEFIGTVMIIPRWRKIGVKSCGLWLI